MTNPTKPPTTSQVSRQFTEVEELIDVKPSELKQRRHLIDVDDDGNERLIDEDGRFISYDG